jgi:YggT family protein
VILATTVIGQLLGKVVYLWMLVLFGRIVLSWFPISPGSALATVFSFVYSVTEPVLGPIRRVMPSTGMFDLSPIIVILALQLLIIPLVSSL